MADTRSQRRLLLALLLVLGAFAACGGDEPCEAGTCVSESGMRLLDRICAVELAEGPACEVSGGAEQTSGITADTIGFRLGASEGALTIHLLAVDAITYPSGSFDIEVLAAAQQAGTRPELRSTFQWGSCAQMCPQDPPPYAVDIYDEYSWTTVVSDQPTTAAALQYDAVLRLSGVGIDIVDVRTTSVYPQGCSIAGRVGSRR